MGLIVIFLGCKILNIHSQTIWNLHLPALDVTLILLVWWNRTQTLAFNVLPNTSASSVNEGRFFFSLFQEAEFLHESRLHSWIVACTDSWWPLLSKPPNRAVHQSELNLHSTFWIMQSDGRLWRQGVLTYSSASMKSWWLLPLYYFCNLFMCSCLAGNLSTSAKQLLSLYVTVASSSQCIIMHLCYLCLIFKLSFESFFLSLSLSFNLFTGFAQREGCVFIYVDEEANLALSKFAEQAEGDSLQSAVLFFTSVQRTRSDKQRSNSFVCLISAICNYTHLFWVILLQWVLWGTTVWLVLIFYYFLFSSEYVIRNVCS